MKKIIKDVFKEHNSIKKNREQTYSFFHFVLIPYSCLSLFTQLSYLCWFSLFLILGGAVLIIYRYSDPFIHLTGIRIHSYSLHRIRLYTLPVSIPTAS